MIHYITADATEPQVEGKVVIVHICNDIGAWGKGFVLALSKKWKAPEKQYREWYALGENFELGEVQFVQVASTLWVANLIGQHNIGKGTKGNPPIRYEAVREGLLKVADFAAEIGAGVQMPRIGCGLAGGKWEAIEPLIEETLVVKGVEVYVCDL